MDKENQTINTERLLKEVLQFIHLPETEQEVILDQYRILVARKIARAYLDKLKEEDLPEEIAQALFNDGSSPQEISKAVLGLNAYVEQKLTLEAREEIILVSKMVVLTEILEPIINNSDEEDQAKIGEILRSDKDFEKALQKIKPNLASKGETSSV